MSREFEEDLLKRYQELEAGEWIESREMLTKDSYLVPSIIKMAKEQDGESGWIEIRYRRSNHPDYENRDEDIFFLSGDQVVKIISRGTIDNLEFISFFTTEINILDGQKHGLERKIELQVVMSNGKNERSNIKEFTWDHGVLSGQYYFQDFDGEQVTGHYFNGQKDGIWTMLNSKGDITGRQYFINGQEVDRDSYLNLLEKELAIKDNSLFPNKIVDLVGGYL